MSQVVSPREKMSSRMHWIQLLAGPVIWSAHFLVSYLLVEAICNLGWNFQVLGMNGLSFIVITLTVLAAIGTILFGFTSYRGWRNTNQDGSLWSQFRDSSHRFDEPAEFVYFCGLLLSALFAATILMVGLPALFLHPC